MRHYICYDSKFRAVARYYQDCVYQVGYEPIFYGIKFNVNVHGQCQRNPQMNINRRISTEQRPSIRNPSTLDNALQKVKYQKLMIIGAIVLLVCCLVILMSSRRVSRKNVPVEVALLPDVNRRHDTIEVCPYGDSCYRKNPDHIRRFHSNK